MRSSTSCSCVGSAATVRVRYLLPRERSRSCPANFCRAGFLRAEEPDDTNLIDFCGPGRGPGRVRWIIVDRPWRSASFQSCRRPGKESRSRRIYALMWRCCAWATALLVPPWPLAAASPASPWPCLLPGAWWWWWWHARTGARMFWCWRDRSAFAGAPFQSRKTFLPASFVLVLFRGSTTDSGTVGVLAWRIAIVTSDGLWGLLHFSSSSDDESTTHQ